MRQSAVADRTLRRILVVDDDATAAWTLALLLKGEHDCEVRIASDGAQAVDLASETRPQVILMDISMPGIDGIEAAAVLGRLFSPEDRPRLIAVTGLDVESHRERLLGAGFDDCLQKPFMFDALLATLKKALDSSKG